MAYYGGPDLGIEYRFVAVRPFKAEQPIGSGITVWYQPGDVFPGEEWGNAAFNLIEVGKAIRLAVNIDKGGNGNGAVAPTVETDEVTSYYPIQLTRGWFELSDGRKVRGVEAAIEAQAELD